MAPPAKAEMMCHFEDYGLIRAIKVYGLTRAIKVYGLTRGIRDNTGGKRLLQPFFVAMFLSNHVHTVYVELEHAPCCIKQR